MSRVARAKDRLSGWSVVASALLHVFLCAFVLLLPVPSQISVPQEESVDVEIVTLPPLLPEEKHELPRQLPLSQREDAAQADAPEARNATPIVQQEARPRDETTAMVKPSHMLSEGVLADPRSNQARKALAQLAPADQIEQLCGLEAMAQVGAWSKELEPDRVVAYAMADPEMAGNAFSADGAAVHSKREWYRIRFKCELTPDHKKVAAFEFLMGDPIPKKHWAEHNLPDEDGSLD